MPRDKVFGYSWPTNIQRKSKTGHKLRLSLQTALNSIFIQSEAKYTTQKRAKNYKYSPQTASVAADRLHTPFVIERERSISDPKAYNNEGPAKQPTNYDYCPDRALVPHFFSS